MTGFFNLLHLHFTLVNKKINKKGVSLSCRIRELVCSSVALLLDLPIFTNSGLEDFCGVLCWETTFKSDEP